jgi:CDP-diacylglycerol---serine O-phosphatidyltransferase
MLKKNNKSGLKQDGFLEKEGKKISLSKAFPNILTICAMCCGLTAIRLALIGRWEKALICIVIAGILDGLDGRLARYLKVDSSLGVELDSLADFLDFGVAPALVIYLFALFRMQFVGWALCLFFTTCTALRLARFNVVQLSPKKDPGKYPLFSVGVPAPAGALIALTPFSLSLYLETKGFFLPPFVFGVMIFLSAVLMISRIPSFTLSRIKVPARWISLVLLCSGIIVTGLIHSPWVLLGVIGMIYLLSIPICCWVYWKRIKKDFNQEKPAEISLQKTEKL